MKQPQPPSSTPTDFPQSRSRRRGLVLTQQGWRKLVEAGSIYNPVGDRRSLEELSEQTSLDPRTIYRLLERELGVDKRTLNTFFAAFNLQLKPEDYTYPITNIALAIAVSEKLHDSPSHTIEEIDHLKQCIIKDCCDLSTLIELNHTDHKILSVKLSPHAPVQLEINVSQSY